MKAPIGSVWRLLIKQPTINMRSSNYRAMDETDELYERGGIFDELVIVFDPAHRNDTCFHLEQMNTRNWYLGVGDLQFNIHVGSNGTLSVRLYDGEKTKFAEDRE